jgi:[acyl-carrier-protein] S-malonyltransferase
MLVDLAAACPQVRQTFAEASEVLGYDLWELAVSGPEARLNATEQTQPAMLAAGIAAWRAWKARGGPDATIAAGHSLGEFSALVCAGAISFADAVGLVARRGRYMQEAVAEGDGGIAAILGLDDEAMEAVCAQVCAARPSELVAPVNYNAPGQVVVAGHAGAVDAAIDLARETGARRAVKLPMSVPVHCALMEPARARFVEALAGIAVNPPRIPVVHNADLRTHDSPDAIREALARQLVGPVRWADTVRRLAAEGATTLIEPGPGRVLTGLVRRIDRAMNAIALHDAASLDGALQALEVGA